MRKYLTNLIGNNYFFIAICLFAFCLPFSQALVSIFSGVILFVAIIEDSINTKIFRIKKNKWLFFIPSVFLIYLISTLTSGNIKDSLYDLNKTLFFIVIPFAFILGKPLNAKQWIFTFYLFCFAVIISTFVAFLNWFFLEQGENFSVHSVSLISHIRFSFQLILAFWFTVLIIKENNKILPAKYLILHFAMAIYFLLFILFQQSLTGIVALFSSIIFFLIYLTVQRKPLVRIGILVVALVLVLTPYLYVKNVIDDFYSFKNIDLENLEKTTSKGNYYWHNFEDKGVENGNYVGLYICDIEMRDAWNKRSEIKYDSLTNSGYPLSATLIRYLTSRGYKKDAEGVNKLSVTDIHNIENNIANYIYAEMKFSIYPRIYQTIWEHYVYTNTGNANNQSFSQRIEFAKAAVNIIKKYPWFGVGTGNWKTEFEKIFIDNNSKLKPENYGSSHNQYLNYMVKFGLVGFILIVAFLTLPVLKFRAYQNTLFLLFVVFMFFANFADSNFESHMGSSFFVFFLCLFLLSPTNLFTLNNNNADSPGNINL